MELLISLVCITIFFAINEYRIGKLEDRVRKLAEDADIRNLRFGGNQEKSEKI